MPIGVIYAAQSKILRRVIVSDHENFAMHVGPGEAITKADDTSPKSIEAAIFAATGTWPPSSRCVAVDENGTVTSVLNADPLLDSLPGQTLVLHDTAIIGATKNKDGSFTNQTPAPDDPVPVSQMSPEILAAKGL